MPSPEQHSRLNQILNASEVRAKNIYGAELVDAAVAAAMADGLGDEFARHLDAYEGLIQWYKVRDVTNRLLQFAAKEST